MVRRLVPASMSTLLSHAIRPHVSAELAASRRAAQQGDWPLAFHRLERAHVLSQASTVEHVRVHGHMLAWAVRRRDGREFAGQCLRIAGAASKTFVGWVPQGNTGGANVSPFRPMPIAEDLAAILERARAGRRKRPLND